MMAAAEATLRREEIEPLRTFTGGRSDELELEVHTDHLEIHAPSRVVALWHRYIVRCLPWREAGSDAIAIVDRRGEVLLVPMRPHEVRAAVDLMNRLLSGTPASEDVKAVDAD